MNGEEEDDYVTNYALCYHFPCHPYFAYERQCSRGRRRKKPNKSEATAFRLQINGCIQQICTGNV